MLQYMLIKIRTPYFPPHFPPCFIKYCDFIKIAKLIDTDLKRPAKLGIERNSYRHRSYAGTDTGLGSRILFIFLYIMFYVQRCLQNLQG